MSSSRFVATLGLLLVVLLAQTAKGLGFVIPSPRKAQIYRSVEYKQPSAWTTAGPAPRHLDKGASAASASASALGRRQQPLFQTPPGRSDNKAVDGTGRGLILWGIVLFFSAWMFTIPTEFRRAHFCVVEQCVQDRARCYDCVTVSEWSEGVADYYRNGGGIEWDFTVGEDSKQFWNDAVTGK
jgi:hypothetical protein